MVNYSPSTCSDSRAYWTNRSSPRKNHTRRCDDALTYNALSLPMSLPSSTPSHFSMTSPSTSNAPPVRQQNVTTVSSAPRERAFGGRQSLPLRDNKCREEKKLLLFIALFFINLCGIIALLVLWNIKGISNQNITWALLAVCGMAGFSVFCCVLYFLVCGNERGVMSAAFQCCWQCRSNSTPRMHDQRSQKFFQSMPYSLKKLKHGFGKRNNIYSVQTVFPTPEFQYFHSSPPATLSSPTAIRPKLNRVLSSSKDSELSGAAFSAMSTAPASSMLDIAEMCGELAYQANRNYPSTNQNSSNSSSSDHEQSIAIQTERSTNSSHGDHSMTAVSPTGYSSIPEELENNERSTGYIYAEIFNGDMRCITPQTNSLIISRPAVTQAELDHSFVNLGMEEDADDFKYLPIPWQRVQELDEKSTAINTNSLECSRIVESLLS